MISSVFVMEQNEYQSWLAGANAMQPVEAGAKLFVEYDCMNCHGTGQRFRCPTLGGLYGTYVALSDGSKVLVDESYIRNSVLDPNAKIADGFRATMPTIKRQLTQEQISSLIAYIKSISPGPMEAETRGK